MRMLTFATAALLSVIAGTAAEAHAFLDHAEPRVGSTVPTAPRELSLTYTQNLEPAFSAVEVTDANGARVDLGKPSFSATVMRVGLKPLSPGTYRVRWHVLSVDTHTNRRQLHLSRWERAMSWFGAEIDGPMVVTRTVHFAASAITAGALIFRGFVAEPALRAAPTAGALVDKQVRAVAWIGLAVAVVSGLVWVLLLTMSLSDEGLGEAVISGALRDVLNLTQFGSVSKVRLALAIVLAICLAFERSALWRWLALAAACLPGCFHRLDRTCRFHALYIGVSASRQRCVTSYRRLGLDRRPGAARAPARHHQVPSGLGRAGT